MITFNESAIGNFETFITEESDLNELRDHCRPGSKALNLVTNDMYVLRVDNKWHKVGSEVTV